MNRYQLLKTWPGLEWPNRTPSIVPTQRGQVMLQPVLQNSMTWVVPQKSPRLSKRRITSLTKSRKAFEFEHTPAMDFSGPLFLQSATVNWNGIDSFLILFRQSVKMFHIRVKVKSAEMFPEHGTGKSYH